MFHPDAPRPPLGTRPRVGWSPTIPLHAAGSRVEPPPSLPSAIGITPAATAAAEPALDEPGTRARSHGLRLWHARSEVGSPRRSRSMDTPIPGMTVVPMMIAPAARSRCTTGASRVATTGGLGSPNMAYTPNPSTGMWALTATGTPCNGPGSVTSEARAAWARAPAGSSS